jgi:predicted DNA-binding antitoxin AbrB/MazE fold protein
MARMIEAVYENGFFKPLEKLKENIDEVREKYGIDSFRNLENLRPVTSTNVIEDIRSREGVCQS